MGIILGAIGGAGAAAQDAGATMLKNDLDTDRQLTVARATNDMELNRQKSLKQWEIEQTELLRQQQVQRIGAAADGIVGKAISGRYAQSDQAVSAADGGQTDAPLTGEQRNAIQQSKDLDRQQMSNDPATRTQAAISTGDITPRDAATLHQKDEGLMYRALWEQSKENGRDARSDARNELLLQRIGNGEQVRVAAEERKQWTTLYSDAGRQLSEARKTLTTLEKSPLYSMADPGSSQAKELETIRTQIKQYSDDRTRFGSLLAGSVSNSQSQPPKGPGSAGGLAGEDGMRDRVRDGYGTNLAIIDENLAQLRAALATTTDPSARADLQAEVDDYTRQRLRLAPSPAPAPAAAQPASARTPAPSVGSLPAGSVQIGTSGGRAVFRAPDGKQYVQN